LRWKTRIDVLKTITNTCLETGKALDGRSARNCFQNVAKGILGLTECQIPVVVAAIFCLLQATLAFFFFFVKIRSGKRKNIKYTHMKLCKKNSLQIKKFANVTSKHNAK